MHTANFSVVDPYRMVCTDRRFHRRMTQPVVHAWRARLSINATRCRWARKGPARRRNKVSGLGLVAGCGGAVVLRQCLLYYQTLLRNCLKSRSVVSRAQKSPAYRSEMSPFAPFRRLLTPSFCGRPDFLDSFGRGFLGSSSLPASNAQE